MTASSSISISRTPALYPPRSHGRRRARVGRLMRFLKASLHNSTSDLPGNGQMHEEHGVDYWREAGAVARACGKPMEA